MTNSNHSTNARTTSDKFRFGVNPAYSENSDDWTCMEHAYKGEECVKDHSNGTRYLPYTPSQLADGVGLGQLGQKNYEAYKMRAVFPDYMTDAVETLVGMLHTKPAEITIPEKLKPLLDSCTKNEEGLQLFLRRINELQLCPGRCGILVDVNPDTRMPYFSIYYAEDIVNWDNPNGASEYIVLDESDVQLDRATGSWRPAVQHRILQLIDNKYSAAVFTANESYDVSKFQSIMLSGVTLDEIPFVFVNARDLLPEPDRAPLLGLSRACYTIYRAEADYRQNLFMQGQDTLVIIDNAGSTGEAAVTRVGAGAVINVGIGGDAKYIGVNSNGLPEQRQAIENDRQHARARAGHFIASGQPTQESGDALRTRLAAQTATLNTVARTGAEALKEALEYAAEFLGLTEAEIESIKVAPNLEFFDMQMLGQDLELYMRAKAEGAPISLESIHTLLQKRGLAMFDYEEEMTRVTKEQPYMAAAMAAAKGSAVSQPVTTSTQPVVTSPAASVETPAE